MAVVGRGQPDETYERELLARVAALEAASGGGVTPSQLGAVATRVTTLETNASDTYTKAQTDVRAMIFALALG